MLTLNPTRAKTTYISPEGQGRPLAMMSRAEAIAAIQELQQRILAQSSGNMATSIEEAVPDMNIEGFDRFQVDPLRRELHDLQRKIRLKLPPAPFHIITGLLVAKGNILSMDKLIERIYGSRLDDSDVNPELTTRVQICKLRHVLRDGKWPIVIRNEWGLGYYLTLSESKDDT